MPLTCRDWFGFAMDTLIYLLVRCLGTFQARAKGMQHSAVLRPLKHLSYLALFLKKSLFGLLAPTLLVVGYHQLYL